MCLIIAIVCRLVNTSKRGLWAELSEFAVMKLKAPTKVCRKKSLCHAIQTINSRNNWQTKNLLFFFMEIRCAFCYDCRRRERRNKFVYDTRSCQWKKAKRKVWHSSCHSDGKLKTIICLLPWCGFDVNFHEDFATFVGLRPEAKLEFCDFSRNHLHHRSSIKV